MRDLQSFDGGRGRGLQAAAGALCRSVIAFRNLTDAISRLSISSVVRVCSHAWMNSSGTAVMRPKAVQFIATETLADSRLAVAGGVTVATAAKARIKPSTGPNRPSRDATIAK